MSEKKYTSKDVKNLSEELIKRHKQSVVPGLSFINLPLEDGQAIVAAYITASELAKITAESKWYRVKTYLSDKIYDYSHIKLNHN